MSGINGRSGCTIQWNGYVRVGFGLELTAGDGASGVPVAFSRALCR